MRELSVAVVDDHPIVREGLMRLIADAKGLAVAGQAGNATDAIALIDDKRPDLAVIDLHIPGSGLNVLAEIARRGLSTATIVLTVSEVAEDVIGALRLGASGYVLKGTSGDAICDVLRTVAGGGTYVTPHLAARLITSINSPTTTQVFEPVAGLSKREAEIAMLVRQGFGNKDIGRRLVLSEKTVKHYLTNIFRKLEVKNRTELALYRPAHHQAHTGGVDVAVPQGWGDHPAVLGGAH